MQYCILNTRVTQTVQRGEITQKRAEYKNYNGPSTLCYVNNDIDYTHSSIKNYPCAKNNIAFVRKEKQFHFIALADDKLLASTSRLFLIFFRHSNFTYRLSSSYFLSAENIPA